VLKYANLIGDIADATPDANKYDILNAIGCDTRVGNKCLIPGFGFGGPCFPRDNRALMCYSNKVNIDGKLAKATDDYNNYHTELQYQQFLQLNLNQYIFDDVAYKSNCLVPIIEESQKLEIAVRLAKKGKHVIIKDKQYIIDEIKKKYNDLFIYNIQL
jgi:UDPglucose 6-dehydrogenase